MIEIKIFNKKYFFENNTPEEVIDFFKSRKEDMDYNFYKKYNNYIPNTKKTVSGKCCICSNLTKNTIDHIRDRKLFSLKNKLICNSCIMKEVGKDNEWKISNSNSQLIAQNRPEQKLRNSVGVKKHWNNLSNEEYKLKIEKIQNTNRGYEKRKKQGITSKKLWQNEEYIKKQLSYIGKFSGISGIFNSKFSGEIRFDSSYELFFLFHMDIQRKNIKRFDGYISYTLNNNKRKYIPDFILDNSIYEIKSSWIKFGRQTKEELVEKRQSALVYVKQNNYNDYFLLEERDLMLLGNLKDRIKLLFLLKNDNKIVLYHGKIQEFHRESCLAESKELIKKWNLLK